MCVIFQLQPGICNLSSVFSLVRPHIDFSFHGILSHINTVFVLRSKVCLPQNTLYTLRYKKHQQLLKKNINITFFDPSVFISTYSKHHRLIYKYKDNSTYFL